MRPGGGEVGHHKRRHGRADEPERASHGEAEGEAVGAKAVYELPRRDGRKPQGERGADRDVQVDALQAVTGGAGILEAHAAQPDFAAHAGERRFAGIALLAVVDVEL